MNNQDFFKITTNMKGFEFNGGNYTAHLNFIDEQFKQHDYITDIHERIEAYSTNLTTPAIEISENKTSGIEVIDGIESLAKYIEAIAECGRIILKNVRVLILKNDITAIQRLSKQIEDKIPKLEEGVFVFGKMKPINELVEKCNSITLKAYKAKINQSQFIVSEINKLIVAYTPQQTKSSLTPFEIALRHRYLVNAKKEPYIIPKRVGEKYKDQANSKNIELAYSKLDKKLRNPTRENLTNVLKTFSEDPDICKAIENDLSGIN